MPTHLWPDMNNFLDAVFPPRPAASPRFSAASLRFPAASQRFLCGRRPLTSGRATQISGLNQQLAGDAPPFFFRSGPEWWHNLFEKVKIHCVLLL